MSMGNPTFGRSPERPHPAADTEKITDLTLNWEDQLSHVYANPETKSLILALIRKAKTEYLEDKTWLDKLTIIKGKLENNDMETIDDEDDVKAILTEALGVPEEISEKDEVDDVEPEEDAA